MLRKKSKGEYYYLNENKRVDGDSLKNKDVTVRIRDTGKQVRIKIKDLKESLRKSINEGGDMLKSGKIVNTRKK